MTNCSESACAFGVTSRPYMTSERIAGALAEVAEDLIVGAVLADDVDDVLDQRRLARPLGHGRRRDAAPRDDRRRRLARRRELAPVVLRHRRRVRLELRVGRHVDHVHRAAHRVHVAAAQAVLRSRAGAHAEQRADGDAAAVALTSMLDGYQPVGMSPRKCATGSRSSRASYTATAFAPPRVTIESPAAVGEGDRGRREADPVLAEGLDGDRRDDGVRARVDDADVIGVAVGDEQAVVRLVPRDAGRMQARR